MLPELKTGKNMRYINLIKNFVEESHQAKLIEWARSISEPNKKVSTNTNTKCIAYTSKESESKIGSD